MEFAFPVETLLLVQFVRSFQNTEGSTSSPGRYSLALEKRPGDEVAEGIKQFEQGEWGALPYMAYMWACPY